MHTKNDVEEEEKEVLSLPRLSNKDISTLSTWRDRLFISLEEGNIFVYQNVVQAARPNKPCIFEREFNPRQIIPGGMEIEFAPAIAENAVLQYGRMSNLQVATVALLWTFTGEVQRLPVEEGWQLWGPPLTVSNELDTFFLVSQVCYNYKNNKPNQEVLIQLYTLSGELVCAEHHSQSEYDSVDKAEQWESNHFLSQLAAPPIFSSVHERFIVMIGGFGSVEVFEAPYVYFDLCSSDRHHEHSI